MVSNVKKNESTIQHVEHPIAIEGDIETGKNLSAAFGNIDAETAKYLNPDIVIDAETNQRIKSMVR